MNVLITIVVIAAVAVVIVAAIAAVVTRLYHKVEQGKAMVVNKTKSIDVTFSGALIMPVLHKAEMMDVSVKRLAIDRRGKEGLICKDNIRADIGVSFYVRVNPTKESVLDVAQLIGCAEASNPTTLDDLFAAKFSEALKTVGKQMDFIQLYDLRDQFREKVIAVIGQDLNGYLLDDVAIENLEQTPLSSLDPHNILDAEGIRKITDITSAHAVVTNQLSRDAEKQTKAKDVETQQALFELDRQEKSAEYKANREMATTKAREEAATAQVEAEQHLIAENARLAAEEEIQVRAENLAREVEVANQNRQRVVAVEEEKVIEARQMQVLARETQTTAANRDLEIAKTEIARLAKDRVAGERTVAEQEEGITTMRVVEDANRTKEAVVISAGAEAEAGLIAEIKAAEAGERAADHKAKERLTLAQAEQAAAEHEAAARIRTAEGTRATEAAPGLAEVEVRTAAAAALETTGLAEARIKEADAAAEAKTGEARATALRAVGQAEADATQAKLTGEAEGLTVKAEAMKLLEGVGQDYDQFVKTLEANTSVRHAEVEARKTVAQVQAEALGAALSSANIDIVGGSDLVVDRIIGAIGTGKQIDGLLDGSDNLTAVAAPYVDGSKDLPTLIASAIAGLGSEGLRNMTMAGLLHRLAGSVGGDGNAHITAIVDALKERGLDTLNVSDVLANGNAHKV